jgi:hypothetical protein
LEHLQEANMSWRSTVMVAVAVGAVAFTAGRVYSQDKAPKGPSPEEMKSMAEMGKLAEQHKAMAADAGTWDAETTMWMSPDAPPMTSRAVSTSRSICAQHFMVDEFKGEFMGMPFEGLGVHGYSKEKGKYFGLWCDSMSSTPEIMWGTADATGKVITFEGAEMDSPMGKFVPRWVVTKVDADHSTFEHWSKYPAMGDDYHKEVQIKYTRRGAK